VAEEKKVKHLTEIITKEGDLCRRWKCKETFQNCSSWYIQL